MTDLDRPADDAVPAPAAGRGLPWLPLAAVVGVVFAVGAAQGPIRDIDLYWHLLVGRDILDGVPIAEAGRGWSFAPVPDTWVTTQWGIEVLFAKLQQAFGLGAFPVYRTVTTIAALAVLAAVTLYRRPARAGVWVFLLAGLQLTFFAQDRSQQVTFVLAPLVGWWAVRLLREGRAPRWWLLLPLVVVWANLHGGWVIVPLALGAAALGRWLDHGWRDRAALRAVLLAVACFLAACVAPAGLGNALAVVRFPGSTPDIGEWQHPVPANWQSWCLVALVVVLVLAWSLGRPRPSRGEVLLGLLLVAFGFTYWRNVTVACLMLAPLVTTVLARALRLDDPLPRGERQPWARLSLGIAVVGAVAAVVLAAHQSPVVDPKVPQQLLARLHAAGAPQRVLNSYNVSGPLLWFGGPPPHVLVGVDGRADRYGADYVTRYVDATHGNKGWQSVVDELRPTAALLSTDEALATLLVETRGWTVVGTEGDYVLLRAPDAPGWGG